ncbi:MAG: GntR family transcriptional regulator [Anaerolineae bacterium]|nr:GntR family transcriptional regulator [Anaerolineae bacterium]
MSPADRPPAKTKKDQIVDMLRDGILSGELAPGDRLLQDQLAERFDVSSTPIREAIQQLVAEGVLSHSPYRGVQVAEVTLEDVHEIYLIRSVMEELATRVAVLNLRIADVKRLHECQATIRQSVEAGDIPTLRKLNYEFHWLIYHSAEMPHLAQIIRSLWLKSPWDTLHVLPTRPQEAITEHERILKAIYAGDAQLAGTRMREHIENGERTLTNFLIEHPS